jgi:hypothetical protein
MKLDQFLVLTRWLSHTTGGRRHRGPKVTETYRAQIPGADEKTWQELERGYRILPQGTGEYIGSLVGSGHN